MGRNAAVLDAAADARDRLAPAAAAIKPQLANAGAAIKPQLANAHAALGPQLVKAREVVEKEVLPRVVEGYHSGRAAAEPVAIEAAHRAKAAAAALTGAAIAAVPKKKKTHKVRTTFLIGAAVGAGYAAWKAWKMPHASDDWTHADTYNAGKDIPTARSSATPAHAANN
jgi:hypothetical protein